MPTKQLKNMDTQQQIGEKAEALEMAKRRAAVSYAKMNSATDAGQHSAWVTATTKDEQEVLRARVDVLSTMMQAPDQKLCLENDGPTRVCVTYDRVRLDRGAELGPMQSTMTWAVPGAEDELRRLMVSEEQSPSLHRLLELVRTNAPNKGILQVLLTLLGVEPPEQMTDAQAGHPGCLRVTEGVADETTGGRVQFHVAWAPLDVNAWEGWQNPSTNAAIRQSILNTAREAGLEAMKTKTPVWSNVAHIQVSPALEPALLGQQVWLTRGLGCRYGSPRTTRSATRSPSRPTPTASRAP